ncbi:MAG: Transcriptional regulator, MerR family [Chloroflexi bacterium AL-W]|nr:Transcriptional regulator, MerR family [Chloroflexi bacterium AL-N1]NOK65006.1 Transcriptional regulator, MerR family [Chloroflexi bacterium AL-N10]NOK76776.1 Transcriptional regulator, MerR family [Chloroflexi bacterium AL-N5]NOK84668.1 Transcriptional regulator, MerR family [Chloroflexi bacterium AL-W]NOK86508.1 Transcriptional regulator, MerR family [Chloroflexi bacterium AL-N15]
MYKIGDFSHMGQVSIRMLRHYDKLGLLRPEHVDPWSGYRYYTLEQLPRLHRIMALKDLGLSLEEVGELLDDPSPDDRLQELLRQRQTLIEQQLAEENARLTRVSVRLEQIAAAQHPIPYEVALKVLPSQSVVGIREIVPHVSNMGDVRDRMLQTLYQKLDTYSITVGTELALYHMQAYAATNIDMSLAVEVPADTSLPKHEAVLTCYHLPYALLAASIVHYGSLWDIPDVVRNLYRWIGTNGYTSAGTYREVHLFGRELAWFANKTPKDAVFEILLPIESLH